jgi:hypothetical protein
MGAFIADVLNRAKGMFPGAKDQGRLAGPYGGFIPSAPQVDPGAADMANMPGGGYLGRILGGMPIPNSGVVKPEFPMPPTRFPGRTPKGTPEPQTPGPVSPGGFIPPETQRVNTTDSATLNQGPVMGPRARKEKAARQADRQKRIKMF